MLTNTAMQNQKSVDAFLFASPTKPEDTANTIAGWKHTEDVVKKPKNRRGTWLSAFSDLRVFTTKHLDLPNGKSSVERERYLYEWFRKNLGYMNNTNKLDKEQKEMLLSLPFIKTDRDDLASIHAELNRLRVIRSVDISSFDIPKLEADTTPLTDILDLRTEMWFSVLKSVGLMTVSDVIRLTYKTARQVEAELAQVFFRDIKEKSMRRLANSLLGYATYVAYERQYGLSASQFYTAIKIAEDPLAIYKIREPGVFAEQLISAINEIEKNKDYRSRLVGVLLDGLSQTEVASEFGVTSSAISSQYNNALKFFRLPEVMSALFLTDEELSDSYTTGVASYTVDTATYTVRSVNQESAVEDKSAECASSESSASDEFETASPADDVMSPESTAADAPVCPARKTTPCTFSYSITDRDTIKNLLANSRKEQMILQRYLTAEKKLSTQRTIDIQTVYREIGESKDFIELGKSFSELTLQRIDVSKATGVLTLSYAYLDTTDPIADTIEPAVKEEAVASETTVDPETTVVEKIVVTEDVNFTTKDVVVASVGTTKSDVVNTNYDYILFMPDGSVIGSHNGEDTDLSPSRGLIFKSGVIAENLGSGSRCTHVEQIIGPVNGELLLFREKEDQRYTSMQVDSPIVVASPSFDVDSLRILTQTESGWEISDLDLIARIFAGVRHSGLPIDQYLFGDGEETDEHRGTCRNQVLSIFTSSQWYKVMKRQVADYEFTDVEFTPFGNIKITTKLK